MYSDRVANVELQSALAVLRMAAAEPAHFDSVDAKADRLLLAQEVRALGEAIAVAAAGMADTGGVADAYSVGTVATFVANNSCTPRSAVAADTRLARWLRQFSTLQDAFQQGQIPRSHLERVKELDNHRTHPALVDAQDMFVEFAQTLAWRDFLIAIRYWMLRFDPDGDEPKEQLQSCGVRARKNADGSVTGSFTLDPISGEAFMRAFESECDKLRGTDTEAGVIRSSYQRGADALLALVGRGFAREDGTIPVPLVNIVMSQLVAEQLIDRINGDTDTDEPFALDREDPDHRCELIDGTPLHPWFALAAMSVGRFQRHVFDAKHRVIETSRSRQFPRTMRHIFHLESRGRCSTSGCDAPFSWLQADHIIPKAHGGETSLTNGQNLCAPENQQKSDRLPIVTNLDVRRMTRDRLHVLTAA